MKRICILGSTGSIGTQSLDIVRNNPEEYRVLALACGNKVEELAAQIKEFSPKLAVTGDEATAKRLEELLNGVDLRNEKPVIRYGQKGLIEAATMEDVDIVLNALVGIAGLIPTYHAINSKKTIALANKETLVTGGQLIMEMASKNDVSILPIDSEHSAIFQCLQGNDDNKIKRILLTASGGPFRGKSIGDLEGVTVKEALAHPKWNMGPKISIDSATLMNKGLEVIEARWLFDVMPENIEVIVHPQSIIHSMVLYEDSSIIAQMGLPDMRVPISYALSYPKRLANNYESLDFFSLSSGLTFEQPDRNTFKCLDMAYKALETGGSAPVVLNAANEVLVDAFLKEKIEFLEIQKGIQENLEYFEIKYNLGLDDIVEIDAKVRRRIGEKL